MSKPSTLLAAIESIAASSPDSLAVSRGPLEITYGELCDLTADGGARLTAAGVREGDRVVIAGENTAGWIIALLATWSCGAIAVPLNSRLGSAQTAALMSEIEPVLIFVDDSQREKFRGLERVQTVRLDDTERGALTGLPAGPSVTPVSTDPATPALISFTSGTTSAPKGALISHASIAAGVASLLPHSHAGLGSITTVLVPLFHNTAYIDQVAHMLWVGGQVDLVRRFNTGAAIEAMSRRPPTFVVAVPSVIRILMSAPEANQIFAGCRCMGIGGSPMPNAWSRELVTKWPTMALLHGYGLTEFTSLSHLLTIADQSRGIDQIDDAASVGAPVLGASCQVRDDAGRSVGPSIDGEIWLSGPQTMIGYWQNPDATETVLQDGWLRTGDVGSIDALGRLWISGRIDDVINRGGEKIFPTVVEDVLCQIPEVAEAAVFGINDAVLGQRVVAAITIRQDNPSIFDPVAARHAVGDHLPDYSWPSEIMVVGRLPVGATGKTDKKQLVALHREMGVSAKAER